MRAAAAMGREVAPRVRCEIRAGSDGDVPGLRQSCWAEIRAHARELFTRIAVFIQCVISVCVYSVILSTDEPAARQALAGTNYCVN